VASALRQASMRGYLQAMASKLGKDIVQRLLDSRLFQDYQQAFSEATRLPLTFHPVENWQLAHRGNKYENPFCSLVSQWNPSCAMCLETQAEISNPALGKPASTVCLAGLYEAAIPVKLGEEVLGFLKTGQIALNKPSKRQFNGVSKKLLAWGIQTDLRRLEEAYFHTTVLTKEQYEAVLRLLEVFAQHLSMTADRVRLEKETPADSPMVAKAKAYIDQRQGEPLTLAEVARVVNTSTFHFCKMFKKATHLTFTEYVALVRIQKAKNLLLNPHARISEVAFEVGFNSLTHFNRVFRKVVGMSPTAFRGSGN
jgi:AraC-like DNA-binding protein/ligand-binding sensor protein